MSKTRPALKPCGTCGVKPVIEYWESGGPIFAVRCDNPDRPDSCDCAFYYSRSKTSAEAIRKWNEFQEHPLTFEEMLEREAEK